MASGFYISALECASLSASTLSLKKWKELTPITIFLRCSLSYVPLVLLHTDRGSLFFSWHNGPTGFQVHACES